MDKDKVDRMNYRRITIIMIMLTILMTPLLFHSEAEAASTEQYLKVGLKYGSSSVSYCTLYSEFGFQLGTAANRSFDEGMPLPAYTKIVITNENGTAAIRDENGVLLSSDLGSVGCIMPADYEEEGILYLDNTPYRGGIMLVPKSDGTLTVVNYITLEHYLYGVLNSELNYTNPIEALKAQAVAARSFGELNLGRHVADGFDLCGTTHCQMYKGYSGEYPSIIEAVDETRGETIYSNGSQVTAFYFKNSGGYTQNSEDVWTYSYPYLRAVKDEYCPSYPWSTSLSFDIIRTKLEAEGFQPGNIKSLEISGRNATGAVSELKITGDRATVYLKKEKIRTVLGATIIKSNNFTLADSTAALGEDWIISNGYSSSHLGSGTYVISGSGNVRKLDIENSYGSNGTITIRYGASASAERVTAGTVVFNGFGYGHGVGMPQDSAVAMAKQGFTYEEILEYFYTDIEIK